MSGITEPIREYPCIRCNGTGGILELSEYEKEHGIPPQPGPCPRCKGKGVIEVEIKR